MEPRAAERFTDAMSEEQVEPQTLSPYALDRTTGFYVKVRNVGAFQQKYRNRNRPR